MTLLKPDRAERSKLENLILYILGKSGPREPIWLSTVLYLAENEHYLREGSSITGTSFIKERWGPAPKNFGKTLSKMIARGDIAVTGN